MPVFKKNQLFTSLKCADSRGQTDCLPLNEMVISFWGVLESQRLGAFSSRVGEPEHCISQLAKRSSLEFG